MAAGGFLYTHKSDRDCLDGGMESVFEPGTHYGAFSLGSFEEDTLYWLANGTKREKVIKNARELVLNEMTWTNLAKKLLSTMRRA